MRWPDGRPAANALVIRGSDQLNWLLDAAQLAPTTRFEDLASQTGPLTRLPWDLQRTDALGHVTFEETGGGFAVLAGLDGAWGAARVPPVVERSGATTEVELRPPGWLAAQVVDAAGRPLAVAGIGIWPFGTPQLFLRKPNLIQREGGEVSLPLAAPVLTELAAQSTFVLSSSNAMGAVEVRAELPAALGVHHELVLERGTSLEVRLVDASGAPILDVTGLVDARANAAVGRVGSAAIQAGVARFDGLVPHTPFEGTVKAKGYGVEAFDVQLSGPGAVKDVVVELAPRAQVQLRGRLLAPSGGSLMGRVARYEGATRPHDDNAVGYRQLAGEFELDDTGQFAIDTSLRALPADGRFEVELYVTIAQPGSVDWVARFAEPTVVVEQAVVDLGDLTLTSQPLILSGRVVNETGVAIAGALVDLVHVSDASVESKLRVEQVEDLRLPVQWTDAEGRFAFSSRDEFDAKRLEVTVDAVGWTQPWPHKAFDVGDADVEVRLQRAGALAGSVRLDDPIAMRKLSVALIPSAEANQGFQGLNRPRGMERVWDRRVPCKLDEQGRFGWSAVPPGVYTLFVFDGDHGYREIDGLLVQAGAACTDPRLFDIALFEGWNLVTLDVDDSKGLPVDAGYVYADREGQWSQVALIAAGRAKFAAQALPLTLLLAAPGTGSKRVELKQAAQRIRLDAPIDIKVRIPGLAELESRAADIAFRPSFVLYALLEDPTFKTSPGIECRRDLQIAQPGEVMSAQLTLPGRYRIGVGCDEGFQGPWSAPWLPLFETTIELPTDSAGQVIQLAPAGD